MPITREITKVLKKNEVKNSLLLKFLIYCSVLIIEPFLSLDERNLIQALWQQILLPHN